MHPDIKTPYGGPHIIGVIFCHPQVVHFLKAAGVGDAFDPDFKPLLADQAVAYLKFGLRLPNFCPAHHFVN